MEVGSDMMANFWLLGDRKVLLRLVCCGAGACGARGSIS